MPILTYRMRTKTIYKKKVNHRTTAVTSFLPENQQTTAQSGGLLIPTGTVLMGIDPGTAATGWAVLQFTQRGATFRNAGTIRTKPTDEFALRLLSLAKTLAGIIDEYQPHSVAIEEPFFGKNAQSALTLGQARGALVLTVAQKEKFVFSYSPSEIKRAVVGNGNATKEQVSFMVRRLMVIPEEFNLSTDATDALAIAYCHSLRCRLLPIANLIS